MFWNKDCENLTEYLCKDFPFHEPNMKKNLLNFLIQKLIQS